MKPSATAAFWNKVLRQMSGRNTPNPRLPNHREELGRHLNQILEHTTRTLISFDPIDLSQVIYSLAKLVDVLRKHGGKTCGKDTDASLSGLLLNHDMTPNKDLFRSFACASRDKLNQFGVRHLSNLAYTYALIGYVPEFDNGSDLFDHIATHAAERRAEFSVQDVSNMERAFIAVKKPHHSIFEAIVDPLRFQSQYKDKIEITSIPERNVIPADELNNNGYLHKMWWFFSHLCTFVVPDVLLCCIGRNVDGKSAKIEAKQAWREKVAIFVIMILSSAAFIGMSAVAPMYLCRKTEMFTMVSY